MDYDRLTREELIARLAAAESAGRAPQGRPGSSAELERLVHELQVHQIELEAQNQALREAEGQIEESRGQYVDLYDFAPIAYCTLDRDGVVLRINLTAPHCWAGNDHGSSAIGSLRWSRSTILMPSSGTSEAASSPPFLW